ncbi:MAG: hypothetical protein QXU32_09465 [Nitrososphaerales archaeon]
MYRNVPRLYTEYVCEQVFRTLVSCAKSGRDVVSSINGLAEEHNVVIRVDIDMHTQCISVSVYSESRQEQTVDVRRLGKDVIRHYGKCLRKHTRSDRKGYDDEEKR